MANWIKNVVTIEPDGKDGIAQFKEMLDVLDGRIDFGKIVPMPFNLEGQIVPAPNMPGLAYIGQDVAEWRKEHWGTGEIATRLTFTKHANKVVFTFETPWTPPLPVIQVLATRFPGLDMTIEYSDQDYYLGSDQPAPVNKNVYKHGILFSEDIKDW